MWCITNAMTLMVYKQTHAHARRLHITPTYTHDNTPRHEGAELEPKSNPNNLPKKIKREIQRFTPDASSKRISSLYTKLLPHWSYKQNVCRHVRNVPEALSAEVYIMLPSRVSFVSRIEQSDCGFNWSIHDASVSFIKKRKRDSSRKEVPIKPSPLL